MGRFQAAETLNAYGALPGRPCWDRTCPAQGFLLLWWQKGNQAGVLRTRRVHTDAVSEQPVPDADLDFAIFIKIVNDNHRKAFRDLHLGHVMQASYVHVGYREGAPRPKVVVQRSKDHLITGRQPSEVPKNHNAPFCCGFRNMRTQLFNK